MRIFPSITAAICLIATPVSLQARPFQIVTDSGQVMPAYADIAGLVLSAPLVIDVTIRSVSRIRGAEAADVASGYERYYVNADISSLLRGNSALPAQIGYVVDVPLDSRGRSPRLKRERMMIFARAVPGRPAQVQLVTKDAQRPWTPDLEQMTRGIITNVLAPDSPPAITGITNAFYVPGTLPGEGQAQFFMTTETGQPVSILVQHQPDSPPSWTVAFSDLVDRATPPPPRNSFAWFRLACGLPPQLPQDAISNDDPKGAQILNSDYAMILRDLGPCTGKRSD